MNIYTIIAYMFTSGGAPRGDRHRPTLPVRSMDPRILELEWLPIQLDRRILGHPTGRIPHLCRRRVDIPTRRIRLPPPILAVKTTTQLKGGPYQGRFFYARTR